MNEPALYRPVSSDYMGIVRISFTAFPAQVVKHPSDSTPPPVLFSLVYGAERIQVPHEVKLEIASYPHQNEATRRYEIPPKNCTIEITPFLFPTKKWREFQNVFNAKKKQRPSLKVQMRTDEHVETICTLKGAVITVVAEQKSFKDTVIIQSVCLNGDWEEQREAMKQWHKENEQLRVN